MKPKTLKAKIQAAIATTRFESDNVWRQRVLSLEAEIKRLKQSERNVEIDILKQIGQTGTTVVECMTKALMSFNKNL